MRIFCSKIDDPQSRYSRFGRVLLAQVAEADPQGKVLGETLLEVGLSLLHERLEDGGCDVTFAGAHGNQAAR